MGGGDWLMRFTLNLEHPWSCASEGYARPRVLTRVSWEVARGLALVKTGLGRPSALQVLM
jgi:hypothetical protein